MRNLLVSTRIYTNSLKGSTAPNLHYQISGILRVKRALPYLNQMQKKQTNKRKQIHEKWIHIFFFIFQLYCTFHKMKIFGMDEVVKITIPFVLWPKEKVHT